jgi:hypothetical protein
MNLKMWLGVALVASMAVFWGIYFALEHQKKQKKIKAKPFVKKGARPSRPVFDELCERHQLTEPEVSLLRSTAQESGVALPAMLFIEPEHLRKRSQSGDANAAIAHGLVSKLFGA